MTDAVETQEVEVAVDEAAFEAGFNGVQGDDPSAPPSQEPEVKAGEKQDEPPPEPERNEYGYTKDEMLAILSKASRVDDLERQMVDERQKLHGKLGEAFRTLQQLQQQKAVGQIELTEDDLDEELREQYPEMGKMQLRMLNKVLAKALGGVKPAETPAPQQAAFDPSIIDQRVEQAQDAIKLELLDEEHPGWRDWTKSQEWGTWVSLQPAEVQQQILNSKSLKFAKDSLSAFKQWREGAENARTKKTSRLEAAVTPTGVAAPGPTALDEEAAFAAGWKSVRG